MSKYILTAQAKLALREIKNYIGRKNLTAARRFVAEFREQCQLIVKFPEMGRSYEQLAPVYEVFLLAIILFFTVKFKMELK